MSIDVASIDMVSEVNMVSGVALHEPLIHSSPASASVPGAYTEGGHGVVPVPPQMFLPPNKAAEREYCCVACNIVHFTKYFTVKLNSFNVL